MKTNSNYNHGLDAEMFNPSLFNDSFSGGDFDPSDDIFDDNESLDNIDEMEYSDFLEMMGDDEATEEDSDLFFKRDPFEDKRDGLHPYAA